MPLARAQLESLLRARRLDRTLTTTLPASAAGDEYAVGPSGITTLDTRLGGGFPRGHLSEIAGPRSSGRTSLMLQLLAAATARGELVAIVDALDTFDVASADAAGIDLDRLLWIRGHVTPDPGFCRDMNQRAMEQSIRALALVLSAGNFGVVVFDAADAPGDALRRLPFTTWLRLQRMVEGQQTMAILVGSEPMARSSAGLTLRLGTAARGCPERANRARLKGCLFEGIETSVRIVRARAHAHPGSPAGDAADAVGGSGRPGEPGDAGDDIIALTTKAVHA